MSLGVNIFVGILLVLVGYGVGLEEGRKRSGRNGMTKKKSKIKKKKRRLEAKAIANGTQNKRK